MGPSEGSVRADRGNCDEGHERQCDGERHHPGDEARAVGVDASQSDPDHRPPAQVIATGCGPREQRRWRRGPGGRGLQPGGRRG